VADLFRMTEATALGIHAMVIAAGGDGMVSAAEIARELEASEAHVAKVLRKLVRSGFLRSRRGPHGGYSMASPAEDVTLLEVYEALEAEARDDGCIFDKPLCSGPCVLGAMVARVRREAREELATTTLAKAVGRRRS
jgi:Rrf2 family protein